MLASHYQWPKFYSLNVPRRGSDDSGYSSPGSRASQANRSATQSQDEKVESFLLPASAPEDDFHTWSSPASEQYQSPGEPFFRLDLTEEPTETRHGDLHRFDAINEDTRMAILGVD